MKLCRAAAVALLGWYFMTPPLVSQSGGKLPQSQDKFTIDSDAPLAKWKTQESFDTAEQCEHAKVQALLLFGQAYPPPEPTPPWDFWYAKQRTDADARCIATDDPRLLDNTKK